MRTIFVFVFKYNPSYVIHQGCHTECIYNNLVSSYEVTRDSRSINKHPMQSNNNASLDIQYSWEAYQRRLCAYMSNNNTVRAPILRVNNVLLDVNLFKMPAKMNRWATSHNKKPKHYHIKQLFKSLRNHSSFYLEIWNNYLFSNGDIWLDVNLFKMAAKMDRWAVNTSHNKQPKHYNIKQP